MTISEARPFRGIRARGASRRSGTAPDRSGAGRARAVLLVVPLSVFAATGLAAQATPPATPPAAWGPVSIDLEEIEYPFPVQYLERQLFGQNARIAYMDVPPVGQANGRTVYLTHGASYYGWYWKHTIDALTREGYRVIAEDRLGWGKSSKPLIPYSWHLHADNMKAVLDHLGIERAAIIGHSMGGQMATRFTRLHPERATHLVMVNPIGLTGREGAAPTQPVTRPQLPEVGEGGTADRQQVYDRHLRTEVNRIVEWRPEYLEHVRIRFGNDIGPDAALLAAVRAANQTGDSMLGDWPLIATKAMVIGGAQDGANFPDAVRNAAAKLQNGEAYLIPNAGHNPHLETPDVLNREIIRFLAS